MGIATQGIAKRLDKEVLWVPTIPPTNVQEPKQEANYGPTWTNVSQSAVIGSMANWNPPAALAQVPS